jgi:hypothetical protein
MLQYNGTYDVLDRWRTLDASWMGEGQVGENMTECFMEDEEYFMWQDQYNWIQEAQAWREIEGR